MKYYIYENWTAEKKAIIHKGDCSYCNQGNGVNKEKTNKNGRWNGPFENFDQALKAANSIPDKNVRCCNSCTPASND